MYDEVVNAAKAVLLAHLGLPLEDLQAMSLVTLSYSRDPDYWQICLLAAKPVDAVDYYTVVFQAGRAPKVLRGRA